MIIEPCCCQNQLPKVAEQSLREGRTVAYHTNGDVTIQKVLFAVACLTGNKSTLTLIIPKLDINTLRYLNQGIQREWWTHLRILTQVGQKKPIETELTNVKGSVSSGLAAGLHKSVLQVVESKNISTTSQMILFEGEANSLVLTGYHPCASPTDSGQPYRTCQHTLLYIANGTHTGLWEEVTKIPLTPLRVHR